VTAEDNGEIVDYIWTFSDDSGSLNGQVVTKRFSDPGTYNISLTIEDAVGNRNVVSNKTITVNDVSDPMAVIKPFEDDVKIGDEIEFNATQSYDPRTTEDITEGLTYEWFYYEEGENYTVQEELGENNMGEVITYEFDTPGVYRINLTVTDAVGNKGWTETNLVVNGADLTVENMEFLKPAVSDLEDGKKTKMSVLIRNVGKVDVNESIDVFFYKNDKKVKSHTIDGGLEAGESYYWNFSFIPDYDGEVEFKVVVDPNDDINEDTDDNNEIIRPATIKTTDSQLMDYWYVIPIIIVILIAVYVVYMKYTRNMWGYEPIAEWWNKRNA
jgi:PKD repeat protein